jgi:peptide chain release factor subunit 1
VIGMTTRRGIATAETATLAALVDRLAAFEPAAAPVLSLYLDARPDQHGRDNFQSFLRKELPARSASFPAAERSSFDRDARRVRDWAEHELERSSDGAAVFCCGAAGLFEPIQFDVPLDESRLYVAPRPHIYPLARLLNLYPRYAALVADTNLARLFVFSLGRPSRESTVTSPKTSRTEVGGWSQKRYQRHVDDSYRQHAREVVDVLERTVRRDGIDHVVMAGDEVILPLLREQLSPAVALKVVDVLSLDIRAPEREVLRESLDALRRWSAGSEAERVQLLLDEYRAGGLAIVGLSATEAALSRGQAHELLIAADSSTLGEPAREDAAAAPRPGPATGAGERAERLVKAARNTRAAVVTIENASLLAHVGGVGALLRYPLESSASDATRG